jgi:Leu/Phe-tRNA-protein transferase
LPEVAFVIAERPCHLDQQFQHESDETPFPDAVEWFFHKICEVCTPATTNLHPTRWRRREMNSLRKLHGHGQSAWLDYIGRELLDTLLADGLRQFREAHDRLINAIELTRQAHHRSPQHA